MKCQKCAKPAVVHLTEIVSQADSAGMGDTKKAMEIHFCLGHAVEAGLLTPTAEASQTVKIKPEGMTAAKGAEASALDEEAAATAAIVPAPVESSSLAVTRERGTADPLTCPVCGMNWAHFKAAGLMGCPHDYEQFGGKLLPLLKRAQEGATEHVGKVPVKKKTAEGDRQTHTLRLKRELQRAVDAENYEQAAQLRDKLRQLEQN